MERRLLITSVSLTKSFDLLVQGHQSCLMLFLQKLHVLLELSGSVPIESMLFALGCVLISVNQWDSLG